MSLPWNDELLLVLRPQGLQGRRRNAGLRRRASVSLLRDLAVSPLASDIMAAADPLVGELRAQRSAPAVLSVVLADTLTHLEVASGDFSAQTDAQIQRLAESCVADTLGLATTASSVSWQLQRDGRHLLICALDQELLQGLQALARRHGARLASAVPAFVAFWNDACRQGAALADTELFAAVDHDHAVVAVVRQGVIDGLSQGDGPADGLDGRADRLAAVLGVDPAVPGRHRACGHAAQLTPRWQRQPLPQGWTA